MHKKQIYISIFVSTFFLLFIPFISVLGVTPAPYIAINEGAERTTKRRVTLTLSVPKNMNSGMKLAHSFDSLKTADWRPFQRRIEEWLLPSGDGEDKIVYIQFKDILGTESQAYSAVIH